MTDTTQLEEVVVVGKRKPLPNQIGNTTPLAAAVQIGGQPFPLSAFTIESGAYGSVGHCDITTSISMLRQLGINLLQMATQQFSGMVVDVSVKDQTGKKTRVFGGEYVNAIWDYDNDTVSISARDWAGPLVDQKRALTSLGATASAMAGAPEAPDESSTDTTGVSTVNAPLNVIVGNIAKLFNLKFMPSPNVPNVNIGTIYEAGGDVVMATEAQTLWGILNVLARDTGNEVYVDPDQNLIFDIPGSNTPIPLITLSYKLNPAPAGAYPMRRPRFTHNARRNSSFRVLVLSYSPANTQLTQGESYVLGDGVTTNGQQVIQPGIWSGNNAAVITNALLDSPTEFPLYTFHVDGLTAAQAQTRALAIAKDIAKREFILTAITDIIPLVRPMNHVKLTGAALDPGFLGENYYVNRYKHSYVMPRGEGGDMAGMTTEMTLLNIRQEGVDSPLVKKATTR